MESQSFPFSFLAYVIFNLFAGFTSSSSSLSTFFLFFFIVGAFVLTALVGVGWLLSRADCGAWLEVGVGA